MSDQHQYAIDLFRARVKKERARQLAKWGPQTHTPLEWLAILGEEYGEACQGVVNTWTQRGDISKALEELVEVAAVCEAAFADIAGAMMPPDAALAEEKK